MKQQRIVYWDRSDIRWTFNGKYHRDRNLPARYLFRNGKFYSVSYWQHGRRHRTTGPAYFDYKYKIKEYYYQGRKYASLEEMLMLEACK